MPNGLPLGQRDEIARKPIVSTAVTVHAPGPGRRVEVDEIRGAAIAGVVVLHTVPADILVTVGAEFSIWQAVPVFMILMGFNGLRSFLKRQGDRPVTLV